MIYLTTNASFEKLNKSLLQLTTNKSVCNQSIREIIVNNSDNIKTLAEEKIHAIPVGINLEIENNPSLNESQKEAIRQSLTNRLTLIQGPPGTGKTKTAVEIAKNWLKFNNKGGTILITADSNVAVDNLYKELVKSGVNSLRIGQNSNIREFFGLSPMDSMNKAFTMLSKGMSKIKVVCTTVIGAHAASIHKLKFNQIIIDEAAQSTEVSNIAALVKNAEQVAIIGDHKQLPPTIGSKLAEANGFSISLFERLLNRGVRSHLLDTQYRMHPKISEFPSISFYDGKVKTGIKASARSLIKGFDWPNEHAPVAFINIDSGFESKHNTSFFNLEEVKKVVYTLNAFLETKDVQADQIGIVTPYEAQKRELKSIIKQAGHRISVDTVDGFQGSERELIIFSAVRSNEHGVLGFLKDKRRLNVMITRAKRGLIVIGNLNLLSRDPIWKSFISWCQDHNVILNK
jgi:superfamily I DNA and/or RNA helicase